MSDDLTIAYMLGVEDMRSKLHKQADEIERLRAENETLRRDVRTAVMGDSAELQDVKRENEKLRSAFRVNMLRAFPQMSHDEIDAEIAAAIRESGE